MTAAEILQELSQDTYAMLQPSPVHGIGVFAMRPIPKGCRTIFSANIGEWIKVPIADVEKLPDHSRNLVETYCVYDDENYFVPDYGFKVMDMVNYLNHSSLPNIISVNNGEYFEAAADIPEGAELLINYGDIVTGAEGTNSTNTTATGSLFDKLTGTSRHAFLQTGVWMSPSIH